MFHSALNYSVHHSPLAEVTCVVSSQTDLAVSAADVGSYHTHLKSTICFFCLFYFSQSMEGVEASHLAGLYYTPHSMGSELIAVGFILMDWI